MSNRELEERQEEEAQRQEKRLVAPALGISEEAYELLETRLEPVDSDGAVVGWDVYYEEGSDPEVLAKISDAAVGGFTRIGYIEFGEPYEAEDANI